MKKKKNAYKSMTPYVILVIILVALLFLFDNGATKVNNFTTGELLEKIDKEEVSEFTITPKSSDGVYYIEGKLKSYGEKETFKAKVIEEEIPKITEYAEDNDVKYETNKDPGTNQWISEEAVLS